MFDKLIILTFINLFSLQNSNPLFLLKLIKIKTCRQHKKIIKKGRFGSPTEKRKMDIYKCPNPENRLATQNTKNKKKVKKRVFPVCDHNALIFILS